MWLWAAAVLLISPAEHYCTLPLFWALMLNANLVRECEINAYGIQHPQGAIILTKMLINSILVLSTWRVYLGLFAAPVIVLALFFQVLIRCVQRLCVRCCGLEMRRGREPQVQDELMRTGSGQYMPAAQEDWQEPLLHADLAPDETVVEVVVYELWPSYMPCYIGRYLGAYHTGIAADIGHHRGPLEYTFEIPDGVKPRQRGRRPIYVQGDARVFIPVGRCKKDDFKAAIVSLRNGVRFGEGENYKILTNNCHTFCDELLDMLGPGVEGRVPLYARFLDDMLGFFIPGGSTGGTLQGIENFLELLGEEDENNSCDRQCCIWTLIGCLLCLLSLSVPIVVSYFLPFEVMT